MKNILVLTDFSKNAGDAAEFALKLGSKLQANLLLFNTYVTNAAVPFVGEPWEAEDLIWGEDDSNDNLNKTAMQLKSVAAQFAEADYKPAIYCDNGEGKLGTIISDIIHRQKIELVVTGARSSNPDDDNLFGSDLSSVIQKATRPIIVVPSKLDPDGLKKVVFATAFDKADMKAIHYLVKLGEVLKFELDIIHIAQPDQAGKTRTKKERALEEQVTRLNYPKVIYHEVKGDDVAENILRIYDDSKGDVLALMHHQNSLIARLFHQSVTKKLLDNQELPLLIFPSGMK
ncbi:MAG TPA: universal stress protein [Mucilaginibacter sp.]|jgi:nucleotide-binding universal stress UspA family protein|nr:universal stress protein [Mucilaginibacter sp.]